MAIFPGLVFNSPPPLYFDWWGCPRWASYHRKCAVSHLLQPHCCPSATREWRRPYRV